jgi:hypothetical protein
MQIKTSAIVSWVMSALFLAVLSLSVSSCIKDECEATLTYIAFDPHYMMPEELRVPVVNEAPRALKKPGKIYYYNGYLFINELNEGVHVIDNRNPAAPVKVSFINIPGNVDMAARGGLLYADNYVDLVAINIQDPANPVFVGRAEGVFPQLGFSPELGILVEYRQREASEKVPCSEQQGNFFWRGGTVFISEGSFDRAMSQSFGNVSGPDVGRGGSMARFTIAMDHLYAVDNHRLHVFGLVNPVAPEKLNVVNLGWGIETIFPYEDKLFIGANNGMHIYDNSSPAQPRFLSTFAHAMACDPVYVDGNLAYVTLRDGNECQNFINQLDVVDVSDLTRPRLLKTHPMHNPHGLSKSGDALLICENNQGLKIFDASDWNTIGQRQLSHVSGFRAYDVITIDAQQLAIVIGENGLRQFDIKDPAKPIELSRIVPE